MFAKVTSGSNHKLQLKIACPNALRCTARIINVYYCGENCFLHLLRTNSKKSQQGNWEKCREEFLSQSSLHPPMIIVTMPIENHAKALPFIKSEVALV